MARATLKVEIGFSANPLDALSTITWTDVTQWVRSISTRRGRNYQAERMEAGTATVVLDNRDRRFDPEHTTGPYYPNVKPWRRIRISGVHSATTYNQFVGYVESWPPDWPGQTDATVTLSCVDAFALFALHKLEIPYVAAVLADSPSAYYRLNETGGTVAADSSGNGKNGTYLGSPTLSQTDPITDDINGAVSFDGVDDLVSLPDSAALSGSTVSLELWIKHPTVTSTPNNKWPLAQFLDGVTASGTRFELSRSGANIGKIAWLIEQANILISSARVDDNAWHHIVGTYDGTTMRLYVDGAQVATLAVTITVTARPIAIGGWPGDDSSDHSWDALVDEVALYSTTLTAARVSAHYDARTAWLADLSGTRIGRMLDEVDWPTADRDVDAGKSTLQSVGDLAGEEALAHLLDVAGWEGGVFFIARDGKARFDDRHARMLSPLNTSQATFAWTPAGAELGFTDVRPSFDIDEVRNHIKISVVGQTTQMATDASSITTYGKRVLEQSLKIQSDSEALDRANYEKGRRKDPILRVDSIEIVPGDTDNLWTQALSRELADRITVILRPIGGGAEVNKKYHVEAIEHSATQDMGTWKTRWLLSPASREEYWILGDATFGVLGSTTRLAY